jgi:hypothetical protein
VAKGNEWIDVYKKDEEEIVKANEWTNKKEAAVVYIENMYNIASNVEGQLVFYSKKAKEHQERITALSEKAEAAKTQEEYDAYSSDYEKTKQEYEALVLKINKRAEFLTEYHFQMKEFQRVYNSKNAKFPYEVPDESPYLIHSTGFMRFLDYAASQSLIGQNVRLALGAEADYTDPSIYDIGAVGELAAVGVSFAMDSPIFTLGGMLGARGFQLALRAGKHGRKYVQATNKFEKTVVELMKRDGLSKTIATKWAYQGLDETTKKLINQMGTLAGMSHSGGAFAVYDMAAAHAHGEGTAMDLLQAGVYGALKGITLAQYGKLTHDAFKKTYAPLASTNKSTETAAKIVARLQDTGAAVAGGASYLGAFVGEGVLFALMGKVEEIGKYNYKILVGEEAEEVKDLTTEDFMESIVSLIGIKLGGKATSYIKAMPYLYNKMADGIKTRNEKVVKETIVDIQSLVEKVIEAVDKEGVTTEPKEKTEAETKENTGAQPKEGEAKATVETDPKTGKKVIKAYGPKGKIEFKDATEGEGQAVKNGIDPVVATSPRLAYTRAKTQQGIFDVLRSHFGVTADQAHTLSEVMYKTFMEMGRRTDREALDVMRSIRFVKGDEQLMRQIMEAQAGVTEGVYGIKLDSQKPKNAITSTDALLNSQLTSLMRELIASGKATSQEVTRLERAKNKSRVTVDEGVKKIYLAKNGAEVYDALKEMYGSEKAASEILSKAGVDAFEITPDALRPELPKILIGFEGTVLFQKGVIKISEQDAIKYAKLGVTDTYEAAAFQLLGNPSGVVNVDTIRAKIKDAFNKLVKEAKETPVVIEDGENITRLINIEIGILKRDGAPEYQIKQAEKALTDPVARARFKENYEKTQKQEIDRWADYLESSEYSSAFKYLILDAVRTHNYNMDREGYVKRNAKTTDGITTFDAGSLAALYASGSKELLKDYAKIQFENAKNIAKANAIKTTDEGEWLMFSSNPQTLDSEAAKLTQLVQGTPWCTKTAARDHVEGGDFFVFVSKGEDGSVKPRIAVRTNNGRVSEVRGIMSSQEVEADMLPVSREFLQTSDKIRDGQVWIDDNAANKWLRDKRAELESMSKEGLDKMSLQEVISLHENIDYYTKKTKQYGENSNAEALHETVFQRLYRDEIIAARDARGAANVMEGLSDAKLEKVVYVRYGGGVALTFAELAKLKNVEIVDGRVIFVPLENSHTVVFDKLREIKRDLELMDMVSLPSSLPSISEALAVSFPVLKSVDALNVTLRREAASHVINIDKIGDFSVINEVDGGATPNITVNSKQVALSGLSGRSNVTINAERVELSRPVLTSETEAKRSSITVNTDTFVMERSYYVAYYNMEISARKVFSGVDFELSKFKNVEEIEWATTNTYGNLVRVSSKDDFSKLKRIINGDVRFEANEIELNKVYSFDQLEFVSGQITTTHGEARDMAKDANTGVAFPKLKHAEAMKSFIPLVDDGFFERANIRRLDMYDVRGETLPEHPYNTLFEGYTTYLDFGKKRLSDFSEKSRLYFEEYDKKKTVRPTTIGVDERVLLQSVGENARAAVSIAKNAEAIVYVFTGANVTSPLHELAHIFETVLTPQERASILDWAKTPAWSVETSEKFARGWEKYIMEGVAPTTEMQASFDKMSNWFKGVYETLNNSEIAGDLRKDIRDIYDSVLGLESDNRAKTIVVLEEEIEQLGEQFTRLEQLNKDIETLRNRNTIFESEKRDLLLLRQERDKIYTAIERSRDTGEVINTDAVDSKKVPSLTKEEIRVAEKYLSEGDKLTVGEIEVFAKNKTAISAYVDLLNIVKNITSGKGVNTKAEMQVYADNYERINEMVAARKQSFAKRAAQKEKNQQEAKKAEAILNDEVFVLRDEKIEKSIEEKATAEEGLELATARFKERAGEYYKSLENPGIAFNFFSSARADIDLIKDAVDVIRAYARLNKGTASAASLKQGAFDELLKVSPDVTKEHFNVLHKLAIDPNAVEFQLSELRGKALAKENARVKGKNETLLEKEETYKELIKGLREKHRDEKDAQKLADKIVRDAKNQLPNNVKTPQFKRIMARASRYVLSGSDADLARFAEIMSKVEMDSGYADRLDKALTERDKLIKSRRKQDALFNYMTPLERFLMIDPSELFEFNNGLNTAKDLLSEYISVAQTIGDGLKKMRFDSNGNLITPSLVPTRQIDSIANRYSVLVTENIFRRLRDSKVFLNSGLTEAELMSIITNAKDASDVVAQIKNINTPARPIVVQSALTEREARRLQIDGQRDVMSTLVEMAASGVSGFERFTKENLMYLSQEDLAKAYVVVDNAKTNGVLSGMGKIDTKLSSVESYRSVKAMFDTGKLSKRADGLLATPAFNIFHMAERMFRGSEFNKAALIAETGYSEMMNTHSVVLTKIDNFTKRLNEERLRIDKAHGENVYEPDSSIAMQIFSHLSQPPKSVRDGEVSREQWLQNEKDNIVHTINVMRERGMKQRANEIEKVYKERVENLVKPEDYVLTPAERQFYDFVVREHNALLPEYQSVFRYYDGVEIVVNPEPYTALSLKEMSVSDQIKELNRENSIGYNRALSPKSSGNKIERTYDRGVLSRGSIYDLNFTNVQRGAMESMLKDAMLRPKIDSVNAFFKMPETKELLGRENVLLLTTAMTRQINSDALAKEKARIGLMGKAVGDSQVEFTKNVNSVIKTWRDVINITFFGVPVFQTLKQSTVNLNMLADSIAEGDVKMINARSYFKDYNDPAARELLGKSVTGRRDIYKTAFDDQNVNGVSERVLAKVIETFGKTVSGTSETEAKASAARYKGAVETFVYGNPESKYLLYRNWGLRGTDAWSAKASWLAYYKAGARKMGIDVDAPDFWQNQRDSPNKTLMAFAEMRMSRNHNVSQMFMGSEFQQMNGAIESVVKLTALPFMNFVLNKKATMHIDLLNALGDVSQLKSSKAARDNFKQSLVHMVGHGLELGAFSALSVTLSQIVVSQIASSFLGDDDKKKIDTVALYENAKKMALTQLIMDYVPWVVGDAMSKMAGDIGNSIAYQVSRDADDEIEQRLKSELGMGMEAWYALGKNPFYKGYQPSSDNQAESMMEYFSVALSPIIHLNEARKYYEIYEKGYYQDSSGRFKYVSDGDREELKMIAFFHAATAFGLPITEFGKVGVSYGKKIKQYSVYNNQLARLIGEKMSFESATEAEVIEFYEKLNTPIKDMNYDEETIAKITEMGYDVNKSFLDNDISNGSVLTLMDLASNEEISDELNEIIKSDEYKYQFAGNLESLEKAIELEIYKKAVSNLLVINPRAHFRSLEMILSNQSDGVIAGYHAAEYYKKLPVELREDYVTALKFNLFALRLTSANAAASTFSEFQKRAGIKK